MRARTYKRANEERKYRDMVKLWLPGKRCAVFSDKEATQCHHTRGRIHDLLLMQEFWLPVSAEGHQWINDNPLLAREKGFLCQLGQWNSVPKEKR